MIEDSRAALARRLAALSPVQRARFEQTLLERQSQRGRTAPIVHRTHADGRVPASYSQQRLWFLDQFDAPTAQFVYLRSVRTRGPLRPAALRRALETVVERHAPLRTTLMLHGGHLYQVEHPASEFRVIHLDLSQHAPALRERRLNQLLDDESRRPFDLARDLPLRAWMVHLAPEENVLVSAAHHVATDGWSVGILERELRDLYRGFVRGDEQPLPPLSVDYADFAVWQRERYAGSTLDEAVKYWTERLADEPPALEFAVADWPRPPVSTLRGAETTLRLPPDLVSDMKRLAQRENVTLFVLLLASFDVLLARYCGQTDLTVGTTVSGRLQPELADLIGPFVNPVALRTDLSGNPTFNELLARRRSNTQSAFVHQELPFERLVEVLHPRRQTNHTPLFQVMLNLRSAGPPLTLHGLEVQVRDPAVPSRASHYDLTLDVLELPHSGEMHLRLEYSTDLFESDTAGRMLRHFETVLGAIVVEPNQPLSRIPLMAADERRLVIETWNATQAPPPSSPSLAQAFDIVAAGQPGAIACIQAGRPVTYAQLDVLAQQLAAALASRGVGPDSVVGLFLERSPESVVGMLGTLKTGAAYLALDPAYPPDRLQLMADDARVAVVVTSSSLAESAPRPSDQIICLDTMAAAPRVSFHTREVGPHDAAYVVYTSGSTGTPRGVIGLHGATLNRLAWMWRRYPFQPGEVGSHKTSLGFVDHVAEVFGPLLAGVPIAIVPDAVVRDPRALIDELARSRSTRIVVVPSLLRELLDADPHLAARLPRLRLWVSSGETLNRELADRFLEALPGRVLLNLYGSSEVAGDVSAFEVSVEAPRRPRVPIGRAIANTALYVLDDAREPVPIGVPGEIHVAGAGLAAGYVDRPIETAERFVEHPLAVSSKLYRTGDLGRFLPDGNLELLGRVDDQIKIRGVRVEPAEVQSVLSTHPVVRAAAVIGTTRPSGDVELLAWVVPRDTRTIDAPALRRYLATRLPAAMMPTRFVLRAELPVGPTGKVDRARLVAEALKPTDEHAAVPAQLRAVDGDPLASVDPLTRRLASVWRSVLPDAPRSLDDNFFDLGGDSLLALRLIDAVEGALGARLPLATFFTAPTLGMLAERLKNGSQSAAPATEILVPLQPAGSRPPLFLVHQFGGSIVGYATLARQFAADDRPVFGLRAAGTDGEQAIDDDIERIVERYVEAIRRIQPLGPYHLAGHCFGGMIAHAIACRLEQQGERVGLLGIVEAFAPPQPHQTRRRSWGRSELVHLARNVPDWFAELLRTDRAEILKRARYRLFHLATTVRPATPGTETALWQQLRREVGDPQRVPERTRYIMASHLHAAMRYDPSRYEGRLTLLRVRKQPLLRAHDPAMGWKRLAAVVDVQIVPGDHLGVLEAPHVQGLASALRRTLDAIDQPPTGRGARVDSLAATPGP